MKLLEVYKFYYEYIKPIYAEIEPKRNNVSVELLFETYAEFDHLKRYYLKEETEQEAV